MRIDLGVFSLFGPACTVLGISIDAITAMFQFSVKWDYVFEYKMDQTKSFAAVAEGIYNEIVARTKVFLYIIFSADTATALCIFSILYKYDSITRPVR